jgi:hypothetical protein
MIDLRFVLNFKGANLASFPEFINLVGPAIPLIRSKQNENLIQPAVLCLQDSTV